MRRFEVQRLGLNSFLGARDIHRKAAEDPPSPRLAQRSPYHHRCAHSSPPFRRAYSAKKITMNSPLEGFSLNGCDTFMLAMDADMRRRGSPGNICHLLLTLQNGADLEAVAVKLQRLPLFSYLVSLRLHAPVFRIPRWQVHRQVYPANTIAALPISTEDELQSFVLEHSMDPYCEAPFGVGLLPTHYAGPSLLFYWHHSLCDARGGESLVRAFAENDPTPPALPLTSSLPSGLRALKLAQAAKRSLFAKTCESIARCCDTATAPTGRRYARIRFTSEETIQIDELSRKITNGIFPMALLLAASARAASTLPFHIEGTRPPLFVPVPHDMRRFMQSGSMLSNHISFLFFKLSPWLDADLRLTTNHVVEQLHDSVYAELPWGMLCFLRYIRRLPLRLLWRVIEMPTKGHPASLYFSDIGAGLSRISSFGGVPVTSALHYPPHLSPPGVTTVWSRYHEQLEVIVCYDTALVGRDGISRFESQLRKELLQVT